MCFLNGVTRKEGGSPEGLSAGQAQGTSTVRVEPAGGGEDWSTLRGLDLASSGHPRILPDSSVLGV